MSPSSASPSVKISIHALREEGDLDKLDRVVSVEQFLSTPSARRATKAIQDAGLMRYISIHALREEGDKRTAPSRMVVFSFLSTPSARRATHERFDGGACKDISIHALREEGDMA